jgi:hypothetical protein
MPRKLLVATALLTISSGSVNGTKRQHQDSAVSMHSCSFNSVSNHPHALVLMQAPSFDACLGCQWRTEAADFMP